MCHFLEDLRKKFKYREVDYASCIIFLYKKLSPDHIYVIVNKSERLRYLELRIDCN
jgi:hypothetical protein